MKRRGVVVVALVVMVLVAAGVAWFHPGFDLGKRDRKSVV